MGKKIYLTRNLNVLIGQLNRDMLSWIPLRWRFSFILTMFFELIKNLLALYLCLSCWASFILLLIILLLFCGFSCWRLPLFPPFFFYFCNVVGMARGGWGLQKKWIMCLFCLFSIWNESLQIFSFFMI